MHTLRAYLQLVRLPAVFTALADIFLGFLLTHRTLGEAPFDFGLLLVASACLYMAGMVFNDVFDREIDARQRPERPIPSGRVSSNSAVGFGGLLVVIGIGAASLVGLQSLLIAGGLTLCIFAYDGFLKQTPVGPVAMGGCRFLNVMLGASAFEEAYRVWGDRTWWVAAGLGIYIAGVTWFARRETEAGSRGQLAGAMGVINAGLAVLIAYVATTPPAIDRFGVLLALGVVILIINRRLTTVLFDPIPARIQPAVKMLLLSVVVLDATLIFFKTGETAYALMAIALLLPALFLGRWIYIT